VFTGIVQGLCRAVAVDDEPGLRRLRIDMSGLVESLLPGASVAINGTCLTATSIVGTHVSFDVIQETVDRTNLVDVAVGDEVNVERSLRFGDEIGGHVLSGHVADAVTVAHIDTGPAERTLWFDVPPRWMVYLFHKGFVALDGASLTIAAVDGPANRIAVSLIPETIERTTLGRVRKGDRVNLEVDAQSQAIVTTVERLLTNPEWRRQAGL
jgi:riboflavin synthase